MKLTPEQIALKIGEALNGLESTPSDINQALGLLASFNMQMAISKDADEGKYERGATGSLDEARVCLNEIRSVALGKLADMGWE